MLVAGMGALLGCPVGAEDPPVADGSSSSSESVDDGASGMVSGPPSSSDTSSATDTGGPAAWLEIGWGTDGFHAFEGALPVVVGPQGLSMFSMPMRGQGFYNPPDPGFDNPDMPILHAWVDVEGYELTADGHFNEVVDYPALFYPSLADPGVLEAPAVWLVLPDEVDAPTLMGRSVIIHAEMVDADGLVLVDEHALVIGEVPPPSGG